MKQVCLVCERTSPDQNLFCQETYCPAEMAPTILAYGEWIGDIEIIKPLVILRSSVLYEAMHQRRRVFLKVAHPGPANTARLEREAEFLRDLQLSGKLPKTLPTLLAPYAFTTIAADAYGKTMLRGHLLYFCLFEHFEGEPLRDVLVRNPQLWINHVCWLTISLAVSVNEMHLNGFYHFALCPECIFVRFDQTPSVPRILLADLGVVCGPAALGESWYRECAAPAYTAPELLGGNGAQRIPDYRTDVYGLGLVLYELLVGEPTFTYKLRSDTEVVEAVKRGQRIKMNRIEDVTRVAQLALHSTNPQGGQRAENVADVAEQLISLVGPVPPEKKRRWPQLSTILAVVAALLVFAFLIAVALSLAGGR